MASNSGSKKLLSAPILGEQGTAVAKLLILEMGSTWHSTNPLLETGIDGWIELRDPDSGTMLNRWIAAQCKARQGQFDDEDDRSFSFECEHRDISYWADGNSPVILIVVRPGQREAWWLPISNDLAEGKEGRVKMHFDKHRDKLSPDSWKAFLALSRERTNDDPGADHPPLAKPDRSADGMVFPFLTLHDNRAFPAIPIVLQGPNGELTTIGILDSGAILHVFHIPMRRPLGSTSVPARRCRPQRRLGRLRFIFGRTTLSLGFSTLSFR